MGARGPAPRPALAVVREGNVGKRPIKPGIVLPPSDLQAPVWTHLLPGNSAEMRYVRGIASELWKRTAPTLAKSVGLVGEQREALVEYCITYARIVQGERALSREGVVVKTERGQVKNAWTTVLNQLRPHFRALVGELGLSPSAAGRLKRPEGGDGEEDPFD